MYKASLLILLLFLVLASKGCAGKQWRAAQQEDTIAGYAAFMEDHPHSWYSDSARTQWLEKIAEKKAAEAAQKAAAEKEYSTLLSQMKAAFNQWKETGDESDYRKLLDIGEKLARIRAAYDSPLFSTDEISDVLGPPDTIKEQGDKKKLIWKLAPQEDGIPADMSFSITVKW